jgi:hypothetical protein
MSGELTRYVKHLLEKITPLDVNSRIIQTYLKIGDSDYDLIKSTYPLEFETLCKIIMLILDEETDNASELINSLSSLTLDPEPKASTPESASEFTGTCAKNVQAVARMFSFVSITDRNLKAMSVIEMLHAIHTKLITPTLFSDGIETALRQWNSPVIDHNRSGMYDSSTIALAQLMLRDLYLYSDATQDWVVIFSMHDDSKLQQALSYELLADIRYIYKKINSSVTKVMIMLPFILEDHRDSSDIGHLACFLIMRNPGVRPFITMLDALWINADSVGISKSYYNRMCEIANAVEMDPISITLSDNAERNRISDKLGLSSDHVQFIPHIKHELEWLSNLLTTALDSNTVGSRAFMCCYKALVYMDSCINEIAPMTREAGRNAETIHTHNKTEMINYHIAVCVLSGYCVLSHASIQFALSHSNPLYAKMHVIEPDSKILPDIFAWAVGIADDKAADVHALLHGERINDDFRWEKRDYGTVSKRFSISYLNRLKQDMQRPAHASMLIDTTASDGRQKFKREISDISEEGAQRRITRPCTRSRMPTISEFCIRDFCQSNRDFESRSMDHSGALMLIYNSLKFVDSS